MPKKKNRSKTGRCVLCTKYVDNLTREHYQPRAWYPSWTPENSYKQTFPSCLICNGKHGASEEQLLRCLGLALDETSIAGAGIQRKAIHALSMSEAPNNREADIRGLLKWKFLKDSVVVPHGFMPLNVDLVPGMLTDSGLFVNGGYTLSRVSKADLKQYIDKLVRGTIYLEYQLLVEAHQEIRLLNDAPQFIDKFAVNLVRIPGLLLRFGVLPSNDMPAVFFQIQLWDKFIWHVACLPRTDVEWTETVLGIRQVEPLWDIQSGPYELPA